MIKRLLLAALLVVSGIAQAQWPGYTTGGVGVTGIGAGVYGGSSGAVMFLDSSSQLAQDGTNFTYTTTSGPRLKFGSSGTSAGWLCGYFGSSNNAGCWNSSLTPDSTNYSIRSDGLNTIINTVTGGSVLLRVANTNIFGTSETAITALLPMIFSADNTHDIGAPGATRPRDIHVGRNAVIGGNVTATGNVTAANLVNSGTLTDGKLCSYASSGTAISCNGVTAASNARRVCSMVVGDTTGSAITDAQLGPQKRLCFIPAASTIIEVNVAADDGTPNVVLQRRRGASTVADLLSGALATAASGAVACAMSSTSQTCIDGTTSSGSITTSNTSLNAGDYIELKSGTAGGVAKLFSVHVVYTIN